MKHAASGKTKFGGGRQRAHVGGEERRDSLGWGDNMSGQLGDGTTTNRLTPAQVGTDTHRASVSAGDSHTVGIKTDGTLWAWGDNTYGQLGDGSTTSRLVPEQVGIDTHWASVAASEGDHTAGIKSDGTLWAWGGAPLATGPTPPPQLAPVRMGTATSWVSVSVGYGFTVALRP